ncbi:MAG: cyclic nucleotide-binding domain-containing protein [Candidatus Riflebacteria bacterium]|nr:cyclic nucleotide-binding domain-containing protein [Candidatus Riflebacteria bacterium]
MESLVIVSSRPDLGEQVISILGETWKAPPALVSLATHEEAIAHLEMEMPEVFLLDVSDPALDPWRFLDAIQADSWLMQGGIVAVGEAFADLRRLEEFRGANLVVSMTTGQLTGGLAKILEIVRNNRRLLYQVDLTSDLVRDISGSFQLGNDLIEVSCYANLLANFLFASKRIDLEQKNALVMILVEMLVNAVEHGNCGISYDEKTAWLATGRNMHELVESRNQDPAIARRRVLFEYVLGPEAASFLVADEGAGFDWRSRLGGADAPPSLELHGRGITLTQAWTRDLRYNEKGNEVRFAVAYSTSGTPLTPAAFRELRHLEVKTGDEVFRAGDPSDSLYYIVKGRFEVIAPSGEVVGMLAPDDLFMGEMSFLLNSHRSASVRAVTEGRLIRVTKREFVEAVRRKPHFALLLSRLLARRLSRLNARFRSGGTVP